MINRSKIFSIVNLLWVSIPLEEVTWWKAKVANEPPFRLELLAYLNWNKPLLFIFYICKSKIKNPLLVWFMKPPKMVYEMVIDRNNFLLITLFHCQILWVLHENSREIECRMKKNITHNTKNYYIRTFIISSSIYYEWLWVILLTYTISVYCIFTARCRQSRSRWGCDPSTAVNSASTQISSSTWRTKQHVSLRWTWHMHNLCSSPWLSKLIISIASTEKTMWQ